MFRRYLLSNWRPSPKLIVSSVMLSGVLLLGVGTYWGQAVPLQRDVSQRPQQSERLPGRVASQVRNDLARLIGVPPGQLQITQFSRQDWSDSCLGLGGPAESCLAAVTPGWRVELTDGSRTWTYRTDEQADAIRLEELSNADGLPDRVRDRVLDFVVNQQGVPRDRLMIMTSSAETWANGCLGLAESGEMCTMMLTPGWQVTVTDRSQQWIYRTDQDANQIRLESQTVVEEPLEPSEPSAELPQQLRDRLFEVVNTQTERPYIGLNVVRATEEQWPGGCLGLAEPNEACTREIVFGWRVVVTDGAETWTYRTDATGDRIRLESREAGVQLPDVVRDRLLKAASEQSGLPTSQLNVEAFEPRVWDGCMGITPPEMMCTMIAMQGWQVIVSGSDQSQWVYHTTFDASEVRLNEVASVTDVALKIGFVPDSEIPEPDNEVLFTAVTTGGFAGQVSQTMLMTDGRVLQMSPNGSDRPTLIRQLSEDQMMAFLGVLEQNRFRDFNRLSYTAATETADAQTVTLANSSGFATQYEDQVAAQLPAEYQAVLQDWQRIVLAR